MLSNLVQKSVISYLIYTRGISFLNNVKKKKMTPIYFVLSQAQSYSAKALKLNNSFKS